MDITISCGGNLVYVTIMSLMSARPYSPIADVFHPESFQLEQPGGKTLTEMQQMQRTEQP